MRDQAEKLREKLKENGLNKARTIAVVSGKGGVGKSNVSINMAMHLLKLEKKVLLFDFDIGMGNIHVLMGENSSKSISDYFHSDIKLKEVISEGPQKLAFISAGSGLSEILELNAPILERLLNDLEELQSQYDYIIFDLGAGANQSNLQLLLSVDDVFVVTTPEPTSLTDAYSMMKYITLLDSERHFYILCNRADKEKEGMETFRRLQAVMRKFMHKDISLLGILHEDGCVKKAVLRQRPFYLEYPHSQISKDLTRALGDYLGNQERKAVSQNQFVQKLRIFFMKGRI